MSDIPNDLFREILSFVPVEPLLRLKCVCKDWHSIIKDPDFAKLQLLRQTPKQQQLIIQESQCTKFYTFPFDSFSSSLKQCTKIVETTPLKNNLPGRGGHFVFDFPVISCRGIVLLPKFYTSKWALWNPCTEEFLELPKFGNVTRLPNSKLSAPFYGFGLGYDIITDDYKVVRMAYLKDLNMLETLVYSVNLNRWRRMDNIPDCYIKNFNTPTYGKGRLHWMACTSQYITNCMIYFDIGAEKHHRLQLPPTFPESGYSEHLDEVDGCLVLTWLNMRGGIQVWVLKSYSSDNMWTKLFSFEESITNCNFMNNPKTIDYLKSEGRILIKYSNITCQDNAYFLLVDMKNKCIQEIIVEGISDEAFSSQVFTASLIRLKENQRVSQRASSRRATKRLKLKITHCTPKVAPNEWFD